MQPHMHRPRTTEDGVCGTEVLVDLLTLNVVLSEYTCTRATVSNCNG